jgi:RNA polymerase sigma-70 factor (ECF subfamily)
LGNKDPAQAFPEAMDDAALITAHQTGDTGALPVLMARYQPGLMGFLKSRVGTEAEDLHQETWCRVSTGLHGYRERGTFKAWLYQIARRLVIDFRRRRGARVQLVLGQAQAMVVQPTSSQPDQLIAAQDVARVLDHALLQMPPEVADVVRLRLLQGVPFKEIARRQDIPLNTALGRMHRALKHLRKDLISAELLQPGSTP